MPTSQFKPVSSSTIQVAAVSQSRDWTRMARVTLLAMAASLLFLASRCHALTTLTDTNSQAPVAQAASQTQTPSQPADPSGAPGTPAEAQNVRVVRLSDVEGTVQVVLGNGTQFSQAVMNMPLTQGSRLQTGPDGRAEIEFEDGSVSRITPNSSLSLAKLSASPTGALETTLEQPTGLVYYELRSDPQSAYTVDFGDNKVAPTANSTFRVNLGSNPADLAVIDGSVQVLGTDNQAATAVLQGKTIEFKPSASAPYTVADGIVPNGFDEWNDQRDQEAAQEAANQTPARTQQGGGSMLEGGWGAGWGGLDSYGGWYPMPGYGNVWQPYGAGAGFDPYGFGAWADMGGGMGMSWISGYPWGWLPFHYGMWSYIGGFGWGWIPGSYGMGMGGYGYGGFGGYYAGGRPNVYRGPAGYRAPAPPIGAQGGLHPVRTGGTLVHVGTPAISSRMMANRGGSANQARTINFNGTKIAPLHAIGTTGAVPIRNAAFSRSAPARGFQGSMPSGLRNGSMGRNQSLAGRGGNGLRGINGPRGGSNMMRTSSFNNMRAANAAAFQNRSAFGNHATFGSHGSFHGTAASFNGGAFHGGSAGGGFHGGGGGFHGGGIPRRRWWRFSRRWWRWVPRRRWRRWIPRWWRRRRRRWPRW